MLMQLNISWREREGKESKRRSWFYSISVLRLISPEPSQELCVTVVGHIKSEIGATAAALWKSTGFLRIAFPCETLCLLPSQQMIIAL